MDKEEGMVDAELLVAADDLTSWEHGVVSLTFHMLGPAALLVHQQILLLSTKQ